MHKIITLLLALLMMTLNAFAGVNVNTANEKELQMLSGIGPAKAKAIIEFRTKNGEFKTVDDLLKVPGIGPAVLGKMKQDVVLSGATTGKGPAANAAPTAKTASPASSAPSTAATASPSAPAPTTAAAPAKPATTTSPAAATSPAASPAPAGKTAAPTGKSEAAKPDAAHGKEADHKADKKADKKAKKDAEETARKSEAGGAKK